MFQRLTLICLALILAPVSLVAGESGIYKWVDDNGEVHYSQKSPAGRDAEKIPKTAPPPVVEPVNDTPALSPAGADNTKPDNKNSGAEAGITKVEYDKLVKENCATARRNHAAFQEGQNKSYMSPEGKVVELTEMVRLQRVSESEQQIKKYCKP